MGDAVGDEADAEAEAEGEGCGELLAAGMVVVGESGRANTTTPITPATTTTTAAVMYVIRRIKRLRRASRRAASRRSSARLRFTFRCDIGTPGMTLPILPERASGVTITGIG